MKELKTANNNIVSFEFLKIEKGRSKLCKCNPPHYELDVVNRIVTCTDCGAVIDAFEALVTLCCYEDKFTEYQGKALEKIKVYSEMADKEFHRRIKNAVFKNMDSNYRKDLYPICPECKKIINPVEITNYANKRIYDELRGEE
nr:MAG TPA: DNA-directed RNA polymerase II subunit [Bacteriophage sp.]